MCDMIEVLTGGGCTGRRGGAQPGDARVTEAKREPGRGDDRQMRSCAQAAKVAEATGGALAGKPETRWGHRRSSRYGDRCGILRHRPVVESVSVLFELYDGDANSYAATGAKPNCRRAGMVTAAKLRSRFADLPARAGRRQLHSALRRKLSTGGLAQVKADLDASR